MAPNSVDKAGSVRREEPLKPLRIIVADDNRDAVLMLTLLLHQDGHTVFGVYTGKDAIVTARLHKPDAMLIDIEMPDMSGYAVAEEIKKMFGAHSPLLIAMSGKWFGQTDRLLSKVVGFDHHLLKPCDPQELTRLLAPRATWGDTKSS